MTEVDTTINRVGSTCYVSYLKDVRRKNNKNPKSESNLSLA